MKVEIINIGIFREITQNSRLSLEIDEKTHPDATVSTAIDILDSLYDGKIKKELYLEDGSRNQWMRILFNGWDTRFLPEEKLILQDKDTILVSSVLVGG